MKRISQGHVSLAHGVAEIATKLEARKVAPAELLAAKGRELEAEFTRWGVDAPDEERRAKSIAALDDLARRARELLSE